MSRRARARAAVVAAKYVAFVPLDPNDEDDDEGSHPDVHQWGDEPTDVRFHGKHPHGVGKSSHAAAGKIEHGHAFASKFPAP